MKRSVLIIIPIFIILLCWSCKNDAEDQPLSDKLISFNLSENKDIDSKLLIGVWELINFSYTSDGKKIKNIAAISRGRLTIPYAPTPKENMIEDRWRLAHSNSILFVCSLNGNLIKLEPKGSTLAMSPPEEVEIVEALINAYSFAIKDNKLIIYFTGDKNKNLLILKKQ